MNIKVDYIDTGIMLANDELESFSYDADNRLLIELECTHQNVEVKKDTFDNPEPYSSTTEYFAECPDCNNLSDDRAESAIEEYIKSLEPDYYE